MTAEKQPHGGDGPAAFVHEFKSEAERGETVVTISLELRLFSNLFP